MMICCCMAVGQLVAQAYYPNLNQTTQREAKWVDSVFNAMTPNQRLGQLFMIRAHSNLGPDHVASVKRLIREYEVGGLCFFQGSPEGQVRLINQYQSLSKVPLMIGVDGEWGLGMRFPKQAISYPRQLTLGAIQNNHLLYEMGEEIARQLQRTGVHVNFAPVVDVNNNAANPVIGTRSFGEDRYNVLSKSFQYMKGMQDNGILACAKHFPGHGDTDVDSHYDLPVIQHNRDRLDSIELYPFRGLIQHGVGSIMVAHLAVPSLDSRPNRPTSLSQYAIHELLQQDLNFNGLVFSDGLEMQGVTKHFGGGEVEAEALLAGTDVLLLPESMSAALSAIRRYVADGRLQQADLDRKVKRMLRAKYRLGLTQYLPLAEKGVQTDINRPAANVLRQELLENALTLVRDDARLLPFGNIDSLRIAALSIGASGKPFFHDRLGDYTDIVSLQAGASLSSGEHQALLQRLRKSDIVLVSLHNMSNSARGRFGLSTSALEFLKDLNQERSVVVTVFGNPYSLRYLDDFDTVLMAYEETKMAQDVSAQALFGAIEVSGRLPITASPRSRFHSGINTQRNLRMGFTIPERVGLDSDTLHHLIDALAKEAIDKRATPGCVVLVARQGQVVFQKAYGKHTYNNSRKVQTDDIYDLASITKVAATTLAVMKLQDEGKMDVNKSLGDYLPWLAGTNKNNMIIRDVLAHQAGLRPWIPFYTSTLSGTKRSPKPSNQYYRKSSSGQYRVEITKNLFLRNDFPDSIYQSIAASALRSNRNYRYSDLGFYLLGRAVEEISGQPLNEYVDQHYYKPLGLPEMGYKPRRKFGVSRIPPTEEDTYWRGERVQGDVHDMGAAMLGGVAGHAGLFSNAYDLAVLMQMLLQKGIYADRQFLSPETISLFTSRPEGASRRGLGFDMPQLNEQYPLNLSPLASERTFGHLGFTGTCVWADPVHDLIFVFLSNRTYPSMKNYRLGKLDTRPRMQSAVYRALILEDAEKRSDGETREDADYGQG